MPRGPIHKSMFSTLYNISSYNWSHHVIWIPRHCVFFCISHPFWQHWAIHALMVAWNASLLTGGSWFSGSSICRKLVSLSWPELWSVMDWRYCSTVEACTSPKGNREIHCSTDWSLYGFLKCHFWIFSIITWVFSVTWSEHEYTDLVLKKHFLLLALLKIVGA